MKRCNVFVLQCVRQFSVHRSAANKSLIVDTPLKQSFGNEKVFFKMDNLQSSGSFKDRGLSNMILSLQTQGPITKLLCSSGGNAGLSVATIGQILKIPTDIFVPTTTLDMMVDKMESRGATVKVGGSNWNEADSLAQLALTSSDTSVKYIPPFDDPIIWEGHSTIVDELHTAFGGEAPDAIILCVGGGGLLRGVQIGLERHKWFNTTILAVETEGAASFALSKQRGEVSFLAKINTIATTLGSLSVLPSVLTSPIKTESIVVSDAEAVSACIAYADESRQLVEPACGATLSLVYNPKYAHYLKDYRKVVAIVCGGSAVSVGLLHKWKTELSI